MSQSNYIAAALAIAFLVYVTMKGSLAKYIALLTGGVGFGQDTASAGNSPQATVDASNGSAPAEGGKDDEKPSATSDGTPSLTNPLTFMSKIPHAVGGAMGGDPQEFMDVGKKLLGGFL
jgi:hypothetical protein